ncbi:MAG: helix-turn-helix transcriptional regulator [Candidatus Methanofastidiosa archaeon]|nr:helix-turn-helix transcriptional regulator [Candidatus Methanofastidiosa archaeon]
MIRKPVPESYNLKLQRLSSLLKEYRINNGYSQIGLSEYLNIHRNTLSRAENGKNITLLSLLELADTLEIDLVDLFVDIE